jgi:hypothetical protein
MKIPENNQTVMPYLKPLQKQSMKEQQLKKKLLMNRMAAVAE